VGMTDGRRSEDPRPGDPVARLMVVCTGNIARSPLGMAMLDREAARRLGDDAPIQVTSSGVQGLQGEPAEVQSQRLAEERGLTLVQHRGSVTASDDVLSQDLVLTMTEAQRGRIVRKAPKAAWTTFTVKELARLTAALKPIDTDLPPRERIRAIVKLANGARAYVERPAGPEDIEDPYMREDGVYDRIGRELDEAMRSIAPQLFGWLPGEDR